MNLALSTECELMWYICVTLKVRVWHTANNENSGEVESVYDMDIVRIPSVVLLTISFA